MFARDWQSRRGGHGGDGLWGNANDFSDRLLCSCWCRGLWLCREGKASLSQQEISSIQAWPGLLFARSCPQKLLIQDEAVQAEERPCAFLKWPSSTSFWAIQRQIGLNQQLGSWRGEMYKAHMSIFIMMAFLFLFFFFVLPAACHLLQCVIVS